MSAIPTPPYFDDARLRAEALHIQRQRQQGLGKPIISAEINGKRVVAVKNRLFRSTKCRTFHDFLVYYIAAALGESWGNAELAKPRGARHPLLNWYQDLCLHQQTFVTKPSQVNEGSYTGAVAAYLYLAYDLYALDHNAELQERLLGRLRNVETFSAARYETLVAALFARAGFHIEFENEEDGSTTHCEFVATHRASGKKFSVEAKRRESKRMRLGRRFNDALAKAADHPRIVFMDINTPDDEQGAGIPPFMKSLVHRLRAFEGEPLNGVLRPPAYVFLTNTPWEHSLEKPAPRVTILMEGFQIPDFKFDRLSTLRDAIDARAAHREMHDLFDSIRDHMEIPSTFDGEIPEFAFYDAPPRLLIGSRYQVRDATGVEHVVALTFATVSADEQKAYCVGTRDNGQSLLWSVPLTIHEMSAWRRHPDTFFGVPAQRSTKAESPLELYDFIHASCKHCTREQLLAVMEDDPDVTNLRELSQSELASIRAERLTLGALQGGWLAHKNANVGR